MSRRTADLVSFMREEDKKVYVRMNFNRGEIVYKTPYFDANDPAIRPEGVARVGDGAADVLVYGTEGAAVIDGVGYAVYSADGLQVATGITDGKTEIPLPSGLYIVRIGSRATKIAVK